VAAEAPATLDILVYGAGAVGSFLGGRLTQAGHAVTLLGRPALRRVIHEQGLRLDGPNGSVTVHPPVVTSLDELETQPDVVLLTVKAYRIEEALPELDRLGDQGATVVTIQNGVGTEEWLLERPSLQRLIAGSLTISIGSDGPDRVRQETSNGGIALSEVRDPDGRLEPLGRAFNAAKVPATVMADYRQMKWSKLLLNMLANATSAILASDPGAIFADAALFKLERRAFVEALAVMGGQGLAPVALPGFNVPLLAQAMRLPAVIGRRMVGPRVASGRGDKRPSLWLDVESGRGQTEVAWLNGAVVRHGRELGIPTPVNQALTRLVEEIARDPARRDELAGHPQLLLKAVAEAS
jgi:2-dehydropantoate 2-reductase